MNKKIVWIGLVCVFLLGFSKISAQDFSIEAELRPRVEYRDGYKSPILNEERAAMVTTNRTRLKMNFSSERVKMRLTLQDARVWGAQDIFNNKYGNAEGAFSLYEAWAEVNLLKGLSLTVGRQALSYDYNRLFVADNWTITGKAHDLGMLKYKFENGPLIEAGFAVNHLFDKTMSEEMESMNIGDETIYGYNAINSNNLYQKLGLGRVSHNFGGKIKASLVWVGEGFQFIDEYEIKRHYSRHTFGGNFELCDKSLPVNVILTAYGQLGNTPLRTYADEKLNLQPAKLGAYFASARVNYNLDFLTIFAATDIYSGTKHDAKPETSHTWNKLYGSNHSFAGNIDYFSGKIHNQGLMDYYGGLIGYLMDKKLQIELCFHQFNTQYKQSANNSNTSMGSELDLKIQYKMMKYVSFEAGYSTYFANENLRRYKGIKEEFKGDYQHPHWAYVSMSVSPELFNLKNWLNREKKD